MAGEIFRDCNGFDVCYRFVGINMTVPHGPGLKQNLFVHPKQNLSAPIRFHASLFMLSLINTAFD